MCAEHPFILPPNLRLPVLCVGLALSRHRHRQPAKLEAQLTAWLASAAKRGNKGREDSRARVVFSCVQCRCVCVNECFAGWWFWCSLSLGLGERELGATAIWVCGNVNAPSLAVCDQHWRAPASGYLTALFCCSIRQLPLARQTTEQTSLDLTDYLKLQNPSQHYTHATMPGV